jgi:hypothetical protein
MRNFSCADDENKIEALWRHEPHVFQDRRSIATIGYEEHLHTLALTDRSVSVERLFSEGIETPIAESSTWRKVQENDHRGFDSTEDKLALYVLIRHLDRRNLETLTFLERETALINQHGFPEDYTVEERERHQALSRRPDGNRRVFLQAAIDLNGLQSGFDQVGLYACQSLHPLRTASRPVLVVPRATEQVLGLPPAREGHEHKWLSLTPHLGLLMVSGISTNRVKPARLARFQARHINQAYIVQFLEGLSVRYCFARDEFVQNDLEWASFEKVEGPAGKRVRFKRTGGKVSNWLDDAWQARRFLES